MEQMAQVGEILLIIYCLVCWFAGWAVVSGLPRSSTIANTDFEIAIISSTPVWLPVLLSLAVVDVLYWTPKRKAEEARWRQPWNTVTKKSWFGSWLRLSVLV